jgi:hypothetical protein
VIRKGEAVKELAKLVREVGAQAIYFNRDPDPFGRQVEANLDEFGGANGLEIVNCKNISPRLLVSACRNTTPLLWSIMRRLVKRRLKSSVNTRPELFETRKTVEIPPHATLPSIFAKSRKPHSGRDSLGHHGRVRGPFPSRSFLSHSPIKGCSFVTPPISPQIAHAWLRWVFQQSPSPSVLRERSGPRVFAHGDCRED